MAEWKKDVSGGKMSGNDICTEAKNPGWQPFFAMIIIGFYGEAHNIWLDLTLVIATLYTFGW